VIEQRWRVCFTQRDLSETDAFTQWGRDWEDWFERSGIVEGTPYLLAPDFDYDVELNTFFTSGPLHGRPQNTLDAYARDMAGFFTFLWQARGRKGWRDAEPDDHLAYKVWRTRELGRSGSTWGREVATVNAFYTWAFCEDLVRAHPIPQRARRPVPGGWGGRRAEGTTPATAPHNARRDRLEWLPPQDYRRWRDIGLRGYGADGLPREGFRGRWAARNAAFADLMVRTGLRLSEQASLSVFDLPRDPAPGGQGYRRFWLPAAIAKGGSARGIYVPSALVQELKLYRELDRVEAVETARERRAYGRLRRPLVVENPGEPVVTVSGRAGRQRVKLEHLDHRDRRRVLIDTPEGLEPAAFWLSEDGWPMAVSTWKGVFAEANERCDRADLGLRAHPHLLRHTFAVVTLEQLQRGHLRELGELTPGQRTHYTRVFGDPLDWVRRRLGHRSVTTTQIYLHALAELEMETRMGLVPDSWENPRHMPLAQADERTTAGEAQ
jgi:site-specific recombinase XerD